MFTFADASSSECLSARLYQEQEESLRELRLSPVRENNVELLQEILKDLDPFKHRSNTAAELAGILTKPHFQVRTIEFTSLDSKIDVKK